MEIVSVGGFAFHTPNYLPLVQAMKHQKTARKNLANSLNLQKGLQKYTNGELSFYALST